MSIAGGLIQTENLPKQTRDSGYAPAGDGRFVVLPNGMKMAAEWKKGDIVPEGHAVINIDYGKDNTEMGPVPVTHGDWTIVIPRGTDRVVPLQHMKKAGVEFDETSEPITKEDIEGAIERHEVIDLDQ